jgi:predicted O-methyltransferase YrrM
MYTFIKKLFVSIGLFQIISDLLYLFRTCAPFILYLKLITSLRFINKGNDLLQLKFIYKYNFDIRIKKNFLNLKLRSTNNWFIGNIPIWYYFFEKLDLFDKKLNILEIGSWEGMSSTFFLHIFPNAKLTCVDTWTGGDEHKQYSAQASSEFLFDTNTSQYKNRLTKIKSTSFDFYSKSNNEKFDLIYIDGSHFSSDVLIDCIKCDELLNEKGLMILDDYWWTWYPRTNENVAIGINLFLKLTKNTFTVIHFNSQIFLFKKVDFMKNRHFYELSK